MEISLVWKLLHPFEKITAKKYRLSTPPFCVKHRNMSRLGVGRRREGHVNAGMVEALSRASSGDGSYMVDSSRILRYYRYRGV